MREASGGTVQTSNSEIDIANESVSDVARLEEENLRLEEKVRKLQSQLDRTEGLCETLDLQDGDGFWPSLRSRVSWLLGLLVLQSCSSFVLASNEMLLQEHPAVIYFLTMLVGAGGNAGNQSAVRIIRGLATGEVNPSSAASFMLVELRMALAIALVLVAAGFVRVIAFNVAMADALALSFSLFAIVGSSVVLGAGLPLVLDAVGIDPAHASTTIQVVMDILGVLITCAVSTLLFATLAGVATGGLPFGIAA